MKRLVTALILVALLISAQGCSYLHKRANDAKDMVDLGFSFSKKPQLAVYLDWIPIHPLGYGEVEGRFVGLGGGEFAGWTPLYERSYGALLWGEEDLNFGTPKAELDAMSESDRQKATNFQRSGLIGLVQGPVPGPKYMTAYPHYLHLGWFGVMLDPRFIEMFDFIVGWTTLDVCHDDDRGKEVEAAPNRDDRKG